MPAAPFAAGLVLGGVAALWLFSAIAPRAADRIIATETMAKVNLIRINHLLFFAQFIRDALKVIPDLPAIVDRHHAIGFAAHAGFLAGTVAAFLIAIRVGALATAGGAAVGAAAGVGSGLLAPRGQAAIHAGVAKRAAAAAESTATAGAITRSSVQTFRRQQLLDGIANRRRQLGLEFKALAPLLAHAVALGDELRHGVGRMLRIALRGTWLEFGQKRFGRRHLLHRTAGFDGVDEFAGAVPEVVQPFVVGQLRDVILDLFQKRRQLLALLALLRLQIAHAHLGLGIVPLLLPKRLHALGQVLLFLVK